MPIEKPTQLLLTLKFPDQEVQLPGDKEKSAEANDEGRR